MIITKVMLVDDEHHFLRAIERRLSRRNIRVITCSSGDQALLYLKEDSEVDVVVLDVKMPGMNGIETLKEIKKNFPVIEVIMLTGHATFESALEGMKLGAYDYLMKPCDLEELLTKIADAADKRRKHLSKIIEAAGRDLPRSRG